MTAEPVRLRTSVCFCGLPRKQPCHGYRWTLKCADCDLLRTAGEQLGRYVARPGPPPPANGLLLITGSFV